MMCSNEGAIGRRHLVSGPAKKTLSIFVEKYNSKW